MNKDDNISMFYKAKPHIFEKAKMLRKNMTGTELKLWESQRGKKIFGLRFRSQHPIDIYIVDFYCHQLRLVIEVDGGIHKSKDQKEYDIGRETEIENLGIKVIRFKNEEIEDNIQLVIKKIKEYCAKCLSEPSPSPL